MTDSPATEPPTEPPTENGVCRARVEVLYERGLHARPAMLLAKRAQQFQADIAVVLIKTPVDISTPLGTRADAKNILDLMFLAAPSGTELEVEARGPDAEAAVEALQTLFQERFGIA